MTKQFEEWALVELFGHTRVAGLVTEAELAGGKFIRIDVPEMDGMQPLTRYIGPSAVYSITPLEKSTAMAIAKELKAAPISAWDAKRLALPANAAVADVDDDQEDDYDNA